MEKKNPYKFTLGFDKTKPSHVRATEILNSVKDKADLIASALVSYIDDVRQEEGAVLSNEALQVLMQEIPCKMSKFSCCNDSTSCKYIFFHHSVHFLSFFKYKFFLEFVPEN